MLQFLIELKNLLTHLGDEAQWTTFINFVGGPPTAYAVMFMIIFIETGMVIMPFLPGDSLLFGLGAIGSRLPGFDYKLAAGLLILAAICGDNLNYWIGRKLGPVIFRKEADALASGQKPNLFSRLLNKEHLHRTEIFFAKHGAKAVMLARFVAIIRTFTPFVAGMGRMHYARFLMFSVLGAVLWVSACVAAGVFFGQLAFVKNHFDLVVLGIVGVTVVPAAFHVLQNWRAKRAATVGEATPV